MDSRPGLRSDEAMALPRTPNRRQLLTQATLATAAAAAALPLAAAAAAESPDSSPLNVLVIGGHPGDPEAGCGGTIARYAGQGHKVTLLYLTRGEAGIPNKTAAEAAAIRTAEAEQACKILRATPAFAGQIDGATEITPQRYSEFNKLVADLNPDVVLTQWPVDTHRDHRVCSMLTLDAFLAAKRKFALYYYKVDLGSDTQCFRPTDYVDVTATEPLKREACTAHQSQHPENFYVKDHEPMLRFRGMESGHKAAEGFIHHDQSPAGRCRARSPGRLIAACGERRGGYRTRPAGCAGRKAPTPPFGGGLPQVNFSARDRVHLMPRSNREVGGVGRCRRGQSTQPTGNPMRRWSFFVYGVFCHLLFFATYAWMAGFVGNFLVPNSIDRSRRAARGWRRALTCC